MTQRIKGPLYIAGQMTGLPFYNFPSFDEAALTLEEKGIETISPAEEDRKRGFDAMTDGEPPEGFVDESIRQDVDIILNKAEGLVMLPGWTKSKGARAEYALARWLGKPVYSYPEMNEIPEDFQPGSLSTVKPPLFGNTKSSHDDLGHVVEPAQSLDDVGSMNEDDVPFSPSWPEQDVDAIQEERRHAMKVLADRISKATEDAHSSFIEEDRMRARDCWDAKELLQPTTKDTNPKDALGIKKIPESTVPAQVVMEVGLAMLEGALKYGRHNYRAVGVRASVYYDALQRHIKAWWEGEDIDPNCPIALSHVVKAMACLVVLRDAENRGMLQDDRPPKSPDGWVEELNEKASQLVSMFPNPPKPYTQK